MCTFNKNYHFRSLGGILRDTFYYHPLTEEELQFLPAQHVTLDKGTGLVHSAPAHGPDDFVVALEHKLPVVRNGNCN